MDSTQHTPDYATLRVQMPDGKWSWLVAEIDAQAVSGSHHRELIAAYKADREAIERAAFKARAARGGFRHVGNSGRV